MKKRRKEYKRKNPIYLKSVIKNAQKEIEVLMNKLECDCQNVNSLECRICILMNQTIPKAETLLEERFF